MNDYDELVKRLRSRAYTGTVRDEAADAIEDLQWMNSVSLGIAKRQFPMNDFIEYVVKSHNELSERYKKLVAAMDISLAQEDRLLNRKKSTPSSGSQKTLQRSGCVSGKRG